VTNGTRSVPGSALSNPSTATSLAGIDLDGGEVTDVVDARAARERRLGDQAIMNGIAALRAPGEFLLTGKTYRYIRHVRLVAARVTATTGRIFA
jgi:glutamine cyclotransferase